MKKELRILIRLLLLATGVLLGGFAVSLYVVSEVGISTISSIPYIFSIVYPRLSLGTASILFQIVLIAVLTVASGWKKSYLPSVLLGFAFGIIVDFWGVVIEQSFLAGLPRLIQYLTAFLVLPLSISITLESGLTALPFDMFVVGMCELSGRKLRFVKTVFDIACVIATSAIGFAVFGQVLGIGIGTIISMLLTGNLVQFFSNRLKARRIL